MNIVIIGCGAAGAGAAAQLRKLLPDAGIKMFSSEKYPFYSRPRVIEYLAGGLEKEKLFIKKEDWYKENNIEFYTEEKITSINPSDKTVHSENRGKISYDKLLIAAGAHSFMPDFKCTGKGLFTLRTIDDADAIMNYAKGKKKGAVIGGGLLGIEAANSLTAHGLEIEIIEFFERLLPRQLDDEGAGILQKMLEEKGLRFRLGKQTEKITEEGGGLEISFKDGEKTSAEMILVSAGIRPNRDIIKDTGIEADKGIKVNGNLRTNIEDIYACGDIAEFNGVIYGIWPAASEQAVIAAKNIAGENEEYKGSVMSTKLKVAGIDLASVGEITEENGAKGKSYGDGRVFRKIFEKDGKIAGAILIGDTKDYMKLQKSISEGKKAEELV
ncbi:MAG TPA: NAD(P)/FAD-dependent oxidoreductase [Firmicutes bacterium]|nr:NAD(P)/FAD-dependent oxidoreductase [Bacillota bacterium]